jgi:hypothetical protein
MSFIVFMTLFVGLCGWLDVRIGPRRPAAKPLATASKGDS